MAGHQPGQQTSFFDEYKLVPAERRSTGRDALITARNRVIDGIRLQKATVEKELAGETIECGFSKWYYVHKGAAFTEVRYGQKSVFMDGTKPQAFRAGTTLGDFPAFYDRLIQAIERGELDTPIEKVQRATSASLTRSKEDA